MMLRRAGYFIAISTVGLVALLSCSTQEPEPIVEALSAEEISAESLWTRITADAPFETYAYWPGHDGVRPGQAPHGEFHEIFINRNLIEALPSTERIAPNGTIIVKKSLNAAADEVVNITVMAKVEGVNPEAGDWYWASYTPDGSVRVAGVVEGCIVCHSGMAENDYIIVRPLDSEIGTGES